MVPLRTVVLFLTGTLAAAIIIEFLPYSTKVCNIANLSKSELRPSFAIYGRTEKEDHLKHVINVLELFGYRRVGIEDNWDLLWAHDYPYIDMRQKLQNLRSQQTVNHFPGCGFITNKVDLSTALLPFMPRAFRLPQDKDAFFKYYSENPASLFVEKHNEHREILIKDPANISYDPNTFIQEYVRNPFLIDGYKFDIGVYVLITSINPVRIYVYSGDVLFRYCTVKYYPFDRNNVDKYIVGDDYIPAWEIPSLVKYFSKFEGSMKAAFDAYIRDQNLNSSNIWDQVERIIRQTILSKEGDIERVMRLYKTENFFDLIRFDFIIDDKMKVHLMEANMSPNLSSAHFKQNSILYEQILYSTLNLVGLGSPIKNFNSIVNSVEGNEIITSDKNLATNLNRCIENDCDNSCNKPECVLCLTCLSGSEHKILMKSHREHLHRTDMKRVFPEPIIYPDLHNIEESTLNLTQRNKWMSWWFYEKCLFDRSWCV